MISCLHLPLLLAVGVAATTATSFSNLINVQQSNFKEGHTDCNKAMNSLGMCLNGCVKLHSAFVDVDNDEVHMNTETYNTTITTTNNTSKSFSHLTVVALLLLWALAFATMEAHQLILLMTMLLLSGGLSTDVVTGFFGAWLVNYLGVLNQTEQGEEGYDIEKDMYYDYSDEEDTQSYGIAWNGKNFKWIEN